METGFAVEVLATLADPARLELYRLLICRGPLGASADDIGATLGLTPSQLTASMTLLERAELATSWRSGQRVYYAVNVEGVRRFLNFVTADRGDDLWGDPASAADVGGPVREAVLIELARR